MKSTGNEDRTSGTMSARMGVGSWSILIVLLLLLVAAGAVTYFGWTLANGTDVPTSGYAAMAFGVVISLVVGFGLMALIFYSSRKGYDEPPVLIVPENDSVGSKDVPESDTCRIRQLALSGDEMDIDSESVLQRDRGDL